MTKPSDVPAENEPENDQNDDADDGDRGVLPVEIGAGAFLHRGGDLLHPCAAGIGRQYLTAGDPTVEQGQQAAGHHDDIKQHSQALRLFDLDRLSSVIRKS